MDESAIWKEILNYKNWKYKIRKKKEGFWFLTPPLTAHFIYGMRVCYLNNVFVIFIQTKQNINNIHIIFFPIKAARLGPNFGIKIKIFENSETYRGDVPMGSHSCPNATLY